MCREGVSRRRLGVVVCVAVLALIFMTVAGAGAASAAEPTFSAHGSVEQVYVTGATPGEQMSLLDNAGTTVATQQANSLGGLLFRDVTPGSGYRVRASDGTESDPLTVLTTQSAPPSTDVYNQTIPSERLRLHDHPRRHPARDLRASAAGRGEGAARRSAAAGRLGTLLRR